MFSVFLVKATRFLRDTLFKFRTVVKFDGMYFYFFFFLVKIEAPRDSKTGANQVVFFNRGVVSNMKKL